MTMLRQLMIAVDIHQVQAAVHRHHQAHGLQITLPSKNNKKNGTIGGNNSNNKLLNNKNEVAKFNLIFYEVLTVKLTFSHWQQSAQRLD